MKRYRLRCRECGWEDVWECGWRQVEEIVRGREVWCPGGHRMRQGRTGENPGFMGRRGNPGFAGERREASVSELSGVDIREEGEHVRLRVTVSRGNRKMLKVPSVSLVPGLSCEEGAPCLKEGCYALGMMTFRKSVEVSWMRNWLRYVTDKVGYFSDIEAWLRKHPGTGMFRWHVGGDIPDGEYLNRMVGVAERFPGVRFLCFTKRYWMFPRWLPGNLTIVLSHWPGVKLPWYAGMEVKGRYWPVAWVRAKGEEGKIPREAMECPHGCEECGMCWELPLMRRDVVMEWKFGYKGRGQWKRN